MKSSSFISFEIDYLTVFRPRIFAWHDQIVRLAAPYIITVTMYLKSFVGKFSKQGRFTLLPDEGPLLETSKILSYFSGRSIPNLLRRYLRSLYLHWQLLFMIISQIVNTLNMGCFIKR